MMWLDLQERLAPLGVERHESTEGVTLSIPVGHNEAIEIEAQDGNGDAEIVFRRWDMTHAMIDEHALATVRPAASLVAAVVRAVVEEYHEQQDSIERAISAAQDEEPEQCLRLFREDVCQEGAYHYCTLPKGHGGHHDLV